MSGERKPLLQPDTKSNSYQSNDVSIAIRGDDAKSPPMSIVSLRHQPTNDHKDTLHPLLIALIQDPVLSNFIELLDYSDLFRFIRSNPQFYRFATSKPYFLRRMMRSLDAEFIQLLKSQQILVNQLYIDLQKTTNSHLDTTKIANRLTEETKDAIINHNRHSAIFYLPGAKKILRAAFIVSFLLTSCACILVLSPKEGLNPLTRDPSTIAIGLILSCSYWLVALWFNHAMNHETFDPRLLGNFAHQEEIDAAANKRFKKTPRYLQCRNQLFNRLQTLPISYLPSSKASTLQNTPNIAQDAPTADTMKFLLRYTLHDFPNDNTIQAMLKDAVAAYRKAKKNQDSKSTEAVDSLLKEYAERTGNADEKTQISITVNNNLTLNQFAVIQPLSLIGDFKLPPIDLRLTPLDFPRICTALPITTLDEKALNQIALLDKLFNRKLPSHTKHNHTNADPKNEKDEPRTLGRLPMDALLLLYAYLDVKSLLVLTRTAKFYSRVANHDEVTAVINQSLAEKHRKTQDKYRNKLFQPLHMTAPRFREPPSSVHNPGPKGFVLL